MGQNNNDISADELLKRLRANLEEDGSTDGGMKIDMPEEPEDPEVEEETTELVIRHRKKGTVSAPINADESAEQSAPYERPAEHAEPNEANEYSDYTEDIEAPDADIFEAATATAQDELEAETRDPIEGTTGVYEAVHATTADYDAINAEFPEELPPDLESTDIDEISRKYLSPEEIAEGKEDEDPDDIVKHLSEAVEYVASIESQKSMEEPKEPQTEAQKVIADIDYSALDTDEDIDEVDLNLMIAFGMEDELKEKLGDEKASDVSEALDKDAVSITDARDELITTELPDDMEFISPSQIRDVFAVYRRKQNKILLRLLGTGFMAVIILLFENFTRFGGTLPQWLEPTSFPVVYAMVSLQLLVICLAFVWNPLAAGLKGALTFKPRTNSILALISLITVLYHIGVCFLYNGGNIVFCNFPLAVCAFIELISEYFALKRDIYSFNIVSSKRLKYVIKQLPEEAAEPESEAFADYIEEDAPVFVVRKTSFVDGFFRRSRESEKGIGALRALLPLPFAIGVFFFVFSGVVSKNASFFGGLTSAYVAFMLAMPFSAILAFTHPFYRASRIAFDNGGAIVGEESLDEYADAAVISFDDKEVFPSGKVKIKSINVYGKNRIDRVIYNLASLFIYIGGPLADVFRIATKDFECSSDVEVVDIADDGIEAVISGKHIFYGRDTFLRKNNIAPIYDAADKFGNGADASITYLVCNDEVAAKLYINYTIDSDFNSIAKQLYQSGICLGIKTFDPAIDDEMLAKSVDLEKFPIKVIKCRSLSDISVTDENSDCGIVSKKGTKSLLKTLSLCDNIARASHTGTFIAVLSTIAALGIMAFLVFKKLLGSDLTGIYVTFFQLFWMIPTYIATKVTINK